MAAALVRADGVVLGRGEIPTPLSADGDRVAGALLDLIVPFAQDRPPAAVGVASAGPIDPVAGTVSPVNIPAWRGYPLLARIRDAVPGVPAVLVGDATAMALGEHWRGAGAGSAALLGIVVSTGVGGGLVLNGLPYTGPTGNAGHFGHVVVDPAGPPCPCGARGCVEVIAAGPAITTWARDQGWHGADARDLAASARSGDPVALAAFERGADALAAGIVTVAAICDLDRVVIAGGVAESGDVLMTPVRHHVAKHAHLDFVKPLRVERALLTRDAGLIGAAHYALTAI
jgi:glucokinase